MVPIRCGTIALLWPHTSYCFSTLELLGDVLKERPQEADGIDSVIVVDNVPQVGPERLEKLKTVIHKIFSKFGKITNEFYPEAEGKTKGLVWLISWLRAAFLKPVLGNPQMVHVFVLSQFPGKWESKNLDRKACRCSSLWMFCRSSRQWWNLVLFLWPGTFFWSTLLPHRQLKRWKMQTATSWTSSTPFEWISSLISISMSSLVLLCFTVIFLSMSTCLNS